MRGLLFRCVSGVSICLAFSLVSTAFAQSTPDDTQPLISSTPTESALVRLEGNVHPAIRQAVDLGLVEPGFPMERMMLVLKRSPEQQQALDSFVAQQYDASSPNFHQWLQPEDFGRLYGPSSQDIATIVSWLQGHGFRVDTVAKGRTFIQFSGSARQVQQAFHTEIHRYQWKSQVHIANSSDPSIPAALAPVVVGIRSLHNFTTLRAASRLPVRVQTDAPARDGTSPELAPPSGDLVYGPKNMMSPIDFDTEYNINPVLQSGVNGTGVTIAVPGAAMISPADVTAFWTRLGIPSANRLTITPIGGPVAGTDGSGLQGVADVEWAGGIAQGAHINYVATQPTATGGGAYDSASYIIDNNLAPIMPFTYGVCELNLGTAGNAAWYALTQQAAAQGITILAPSGDYGSADCDLQAPAQYGLQVDGIASSPFVTAVGGTDRAAAPQWNSGNLAQYFPETTWNASCADPLLGQPCPGVYFYGSGGGVSACTNPSSATPAVCSGGYPKPSYQTGIGVPADGARDIPDLSFFSSIGTLGTGMAVECTLGAGANDCTDTGGSPQVIETGGTPFAADAMAGIMALIVQKAGSRQGTANYALYNLANQDNRSACSSSTVAPGNSCYFYDITTGNNQEPCSLSSPYPGCTGSGSQALLSGYAAGTGYDLATGLGSMNVANVVQNWPASFTPAPKFTLPASLRFPATLVGVTSAPIPFQITNTGSGTLYINSITVTGTEAAEFSVTTNCGTYLAAGSTCSSSLTFTPLFAGTRKATVVVTGGWNGTQSFPILGPGIGLVFSASTITLPKTSVGSVSHAASLKLINPSYSVLSLDSIAIGGANPGSFTQLNNCGTSLAKSSSCTLMVAFAPQSATVQSASVTVLSAGNSIPQVVNLTGTGLAQPTVTLNPTALDFTASQQGTNFAAPVVLTNTSTVPLTISQIAFSGTGAQSFQQVNNCPTVLNAASFCTIMVAFVPPASGSYAASLTISDNAAGFSQTVPLTGTTP